VEDDVVLPRSHFSKRVKEMLVPREVGILKSEFTWSISDAWAKEKQKKEGSGC
jgi:hypothetical protein